jgi:dihydroorotate dehydrogenase electron transfer subunit
MRKYQKKTVVISNQKIGPEHHLLRFRFDEGASVTVPGQFLMIQPADAVSPLLRRPFGVHAVTGNSVSILYEVVGTSTQILAKKKAGDAIGVIGPCGSGFDFPKSAKCSPLLVAGGMGVAPLMFLAKKLGHGVVVLGARTKKHLLCEKEFKAIGCEAVVATDDGSKGFHGYVTQLLEKVLAKNPESRNKYTLYACGPAPMLKEVCRITAEQSISCQVSLEAHMACGIGACLGCAVQTVSGYKRVCHDGPVFKADELVW